MTWVRVLTAVFGAVMLGFGGFFGWLMLKTRRRKGWSDGTSRAYLLTRAVTAAVVGASLIAGAIWKLRDVGYVAAGALLASAVVYNILARRLKRAERRASQAENG
ncbi:MAG TPA: hypothetical protein VFC31_09505 [Candidatus Limnocylindria bacterium]|nr:hypothetical protein [Candidatus Limnocylindria bacterium]